VRDRRKFALVKQQFVQDMQFNLGTGIVTKAT